MQLSAAPPRRQGSVVGIVLGAALTAVLALGALPAEAGYRETTRATPGLVGYWRLGEQAGITAADELGAQSGTYRGTVTLRQPGAISGDPSTSASFDAPGDFVQVPHRPAHNVNGFTVELWIYPVGVGDTTRWRRIASKGATTNQRNWLIAFQQGTTGAINYSFGTTAGVTVSGQSRTSLALGRWYQIAMVHVPGQRIQLYVNGVLDSERVTTAIPATTSSPLYIAGDGYDAGSNARFDEVAYFNRALSSSEIRQAYVAAGASKDTIPPDTTLVSGPVGAIATHTPALSFTANEAGSSFQCQSDAGAWSSCASPYTALTLIDGAHTFAVRAIDPAGNIDPTPATRAFTVDTTPPDTTLTGPPDPTVNPRPAFTLAGSEPRSTLQCSVDGGPFTSCGVSWTAPAMADGRHTVAARAVDAAGNVDPSPATASFTVDATAPETSIDSGPTGPVASSSPSFGFSSPEAGTRFECRLDVGPWAGCSAPFAALVLLDGPHTFAARAIDAAGNTDPTPATRAFTVDTITPDTTITGPPDHTANPRPAFSIAGSEPGATLQCNVDGGGWAGCSSPFTAPALADGAHTVSARAVDAAGNIDSTPASAPFTVDTAAPETALDSGPDGFVASADATLAFSSPEAGVGFECRLDSGTWGGCASPRAFASLPEGDRTFDVRAVDAAGNADPTPATRSWTVETTAPDTTIDSGPTGPTSDASPSFRFSASEPSTTFACRLDAGDWAACDSPFRAPVLPDGPHNFEVLATDRAGNADATPAAAAFTVDTAPPDTSIDSAPADTEFSPSARFSFSSAGGDAFECRIDEGGWELCSAPKAYDGLANGSHTLDVRALDDAGNRDPSPATRTWTVARPSDYANVILRESGLVSLWRLGEASGPAAADLAGRNDGAYDGSVALGEPGAIANDPDTAARTGVGSRVVVPSSASLATPEVTIEAWVKPDDVSPGTGGTIAEKAGSYRLAADGASLRFELQTTRVGAAPPAVSYDIGGALHAGRWQHVVATFDGWNAFVFVDGVNAATQRIVDETVVDPANHPDAIAPSGSPLVLGEGLNGALDDVAVYDHALPPLVVEDHHRHGLDSAAQQTSCTPQFGSFAVGSWPPGCWRPYSDASPFNRRIPSNPTLDADSSRIVSTLMSWGDPPFQGVPSQLNSPRVPSADWLHPTYWSQPSDPLYTVDCTYDGRWGPCPVDGLRLRIPAAAKPAADGSADHDRHMTVVDQRSGWEYDFWGASKAGTTLTTKWGGVTPINGDGLASAATAARFGNLAGIIRAPEMAAGRIDHALFMIVHCVNSDDTVPAEAVYPALDDGQPCSWLGRDGTYAPRMGARFQLDISDAELNAITPAWQRTVLRAMRDYGMIVGDTGGGTYGWGIQAESDATYTSFPGQPGQMEAFGRSNGWLMVPSHAIGDMRMTRSFWESRLRVVAPCVSRGSC